VPALSAGLAVAAGALGLARRPVAGVSAFVPADLLVFLAFLAWVVVGTVIVVRRPDNRIGWILCAAGSLVLVGGFAAEYAVSALLGGWSALPAGRALAWVAPWTTVLGLGLFFYLLLLFPDGRLPSRRWRWLARLYAAALAAGIVALAFRPGVFLPTLRGLGPLRNPLRLPAAAPVLDPVNATSRVLISVLYLAAVGALLLRLRRARGIERAQLKWVAYAAAVLIGFLLVINLLEGRAVAPLVRLGAVYAAVVSAVAFPPVACCR
jgi:two-component system, NarL family, sensor kinase